MSSVFFDEMALKMCLIAFITTQFCIGQPPECPQRNISCDDIKAPDGFKFPHGCPTDSEVDILADDKMTVLANALLSTQSFSEFTEVRIDNKSATTTHCRNLTIKCLINDGKYVRETCEDIKITDVIESSDSPEPRGLILLLSVSVSVTIMTAVGFGILCWHYKSWKKEQRRQHGATTPSGFFPYLMTWSCFKKGISLLERGEREETSGGTELQVVTAETQHSRIVNPRDGYPRGSGENETGEDSTLGSVRVCSEDISAPNVNGDSLHRAVNRDDSGGAKSDERKDTLRKMAGGDHNAEDRETEGRQLLPNRRAAIQDFDMIGEDTALVNKPGSDPDQVSGCSAAPETDVESTHNMEN